MSSRSPYVRAGCLFLLGGCAGEASPPPKPVVVSMPNIASSAKPAPENDAGKEGWLRTTGGSHTCLLRSDRLRCWGFNQYGQLGDGSTLDRAKPTHVAVRDVKMLSVGGVNTCFVDARGRVTCWGSNTWGQLARTGKASSKPVLVDGVTDAVEVAVGTGTTCVRHRVGTVSCWGDASNGQLGPGELDRAITPITVPLLVDAVELAVDSYLVCARRKNDRVVCWGDPWMGLMPGKEPPVGYAVTSSPSEVPGINDATQLALGDHHACILSRSGEVRCWGGNASGALGRGTTGSEASGEYDFRPGMVEGLPLARQIAAGADHSCAVDVEHRVWCWGGNRYGQLGTGAVAERAPPAAVPLPGLVSQVVAGAVHSCAMLESGDVYCWGSNLSSQCGLEGAGPVLEPRLVDGLAPLKP